MPDIVHVTTHESWLSRIGKAITGVAIGLLLFLAAFPLLWWNEGRAVHRARSLAEGASIVADVPADRVDAANEGKLVHVTGLATTDEILTDPEFGVSSTAVRLARVAETYQWREESSTKKRKRLGGGEETTTTYRYSKTWSSSHIDSSGFHERGGHENPASLTWESRTMTAGSVRLGAFILSPELVGKIDATSARPADPGDAEKMAAHGFTASEGGSFYRGASSSAPQVGDVRVRFEVITPQTVSVVAAQRGSSFATYEARAGSGILLLEEGAVPADQMFKAARRANTALTWALRAGGLLVMFIGLVLILKPISVVGSVVPLVGTLLGAGAGLLSFVLALALSLTTISLAWLAYRPLLGGALLLAAAGSIVLLVRARRPKAVVPPPIPQV